MLAPRAPSPPSAEVVRRLAAKHTEFLSFLASRLRSRAVAEEILQVAFVRMLERGGSIEQEESAVAWFYRMLRNALADYYRNTASETRALEGFSLEPGADPETYHAVCACLRGVVPTLKAEYADLIARVDLDDQPIAEVAKALEISKNNATVRLHRARQALKVQLQRACGACAEHGCLDCTCPRKGA